MLNTQRFLYIMLIKSYVLFSS